MKTISRSLILLALVCILAVAVFAIQTKTLATNETNVATSAGNMNLDLGTKIGGGNPCNQVPVSCYTITLSESRTMLTIEDGPVFFDVGVKIACQNEPGVPDNCHPL